MGAGLAMVMLLVGVYFCLEKTVVVKVDDKTIETTTFKRSVGEVLKEQNIALHTKDVVEPGLNAEIKEEQIIKITRAFPVKVVADGKVQEVLSIPVKVAQVLDAAGVIVGPSDKVSADLQSMTQNGQTIKVIRVLEKVVNEKTPIPYRMVSTSDSFLEKGLTRTVSKGKPGVALETIKITYHDGVEIRREVLKAEIVKKPVDKVVAMGVITSVSRGGLRLNFARAIQVSSTAYTYTGHRTACGLTPKVGLVAVDPRVIPLGSKLYIEGYGFAQAADRGSAIKGNKLDVFLETLGQCTKWGRRTVKVYVLN
ncbi:MAG: 3D domain-containing protein [Acidobacteriota bacterium]